MVGMMGEGIVSPCLPMRAGNLVGTVKPAERAALVAVQVIRGLEMVAMASRPVMVAATFRVGFANRCSMIMAVAMVVLSQRRCRHP